MSEVLFSPAAPNVSYFTPEQPIPAGTAINPQPDGRPIPTLFQPIKIRGVEFQNRIWLSPLCQYSSEDGFVSAWHMAHLGGILTRGPGLSFTEACAVTPEGRITGDDLGIWSDDHIEPLSKITEFAHSQNQKMGIQLSHTGRKASLLPPWLGGGLAEGPVQRGWTDNVWGPSTMPFSPNHAQPKEMTIERIKNIVEAHKQAAIRAVKAGFDVIEITAAHGYILSSFMSPQSNNRTDEYGGSWENRVKLTLETVDAIRGVIPETMPLFVRLSGTEWLEEIAPDEPSWKAEDAARLSHILADHGVDVIVMSAGGMNSRQRVHPLAKQPAYQSPYAAAVKNSVGDKVLVASVGGLGDGPLAQELLDNGTADIIFAGRGFMRNPGLVWEMADELGVQIRHATQIQWAFQGRRKAKAELLKQAKGEL